MSDVNELLIQPLQKFSKDSMHLIKKCTKPDRKGESIFAGLSSFVVLGTLAGLSRRKIGPGIHGDGTGVYGEATGGVFETGERIGGEMLVLKKRTGVSCGVASTHRLAAAARPPVLIAVQNQCNDVLCTWCPVSVPFSALCEYVIAIVVC